MNTLLVIWRAALRSSTNGLRQDRRARIGISLALAIQLGSGIWACLRLFAALTVWQVEGVLVSHLWLVCLAAWSIMAFFSVLATFQYALNSNEALLLTLQPIASSTRWRALYGLILLKGSGNWLCWEIGVLGLALAPVLGWSSLLWLALLGAGAALVVLLAQLITFLVLRFLLPHLRTMLGIAAGLLVLPYLLFLLVSGPNWNFLFGVERVLTVLTNWFAPGRSLVAFAPELALLSMVLILLVALLPMAGPLGQFYLATVQFSQGQSEKINTLALPGLPLLLTVLGRSRTMTAALLVKGLLNQSRHLFAWLRLLVFIVLLALFKVICAALSPLHLTSPLLVANYATFLLALILLEYAPYSISSEGQRLTLYLVMPRGLVSFLRGRLYTFLCLALLPGLSVALLLGLWTGLSALDLGKALLLVLLLLPGYTAFAVLGSALDEDLSLAIEDRLQALMQEEMPVTPRRLQLLALAIVLLGAELVLTWRVPFLLVMPLLALLDAVILLVMWRLSMSYLLRLQR